MLALNVTTREYMRLQTNTAAARASLPLVDGNLVPISALMMVGRSLGLPLGALTDDVLVLRVRRDVLAIPADERLTEPN